jgi:hypothetical protein
VPQDPQFVGSVRTFTHAPSHIVPFAPEHVHTHSPPAHAWPAAHAAPHAPQFAGSVPTSTHAPPHAVAFAPEQVQTQAPLEQSWPGAQAWLHAPQFAGSIAGITQVPAQSTWPAGHPGGAGFELPPPQAAASSVRHTTSARAFTDMITRLSVGRDCR